MIDCLSVTVWSWRSSSVSTGVCQHWGLKLPPPPILILNKLLFLNKECEVTYFIVEHCWAFCIGLAHGEAEWQPPHPAFS